MIPKFILPIYTLFYIKCILSIKIKLNIGTIYTENNDNQLKLSGLEYLGLGYNIKDSMPLGNEEDTLIDPGYKEPIIVFNRINEKLEDSLKNAEKVLPTGVWIRNESLCYKTFFVSKASKNKSIIGVLNEDIKINIISDNVYTAKKLNEKLSHKIKGAHLNVYKLNCSIHTAGMILSYQWNLKESVLVLLKKLNGFTKQNETKNDENNSEKIIKNIWFELFDIYGTHVMTKITLGGKIIEISDISGKSNKKEATSQDTRRLNLTIFKLNSSNDISSNEKLLNKSKYEKIIIIGGSIDSDENNDDTVKDYRGIDKGKWIKSIRKNPVPIKFELTTLGYFIYQNFQNMALLESFEKNLRDYLD